MGMFNPKNRKVIICNHCSDSGAGNGSADSICLWSLLRGSRMRLGQKAMEASTGQKLPDACNREMNWLWHARWHWEEPLVLAKNEKRNCQSDLSATVCCCSRNTDSKKTMKAEI